VTLWYYDASDRITHRTVDGERAEQWRYDDHGWLAELSHLSEGHRIATGYRYDRKGRLISERQTVHHPETDELLWQHETKLAWNEQSLVNRVKPDNLSPVEWLTYGSGHLAGMKLGDTPLVDFTRDRLHRETQRQYSAYGQTTTYTAAGQLQSQHLTLTPYSRDYGYDSTGRLVSIREAHQTREYAYSGSGRLTGTTLTRDAVHLDIPYEMDAAGNRVEEKALREVLRLPELSPDNRIAKDTLYLYRYDASGNLIEKSTHVPAGAIRSGNEKTHHYSYDRQHRLVHYRLTHSFGNQEITRSRYLYDAMGRRVGRMVWQCPRLMTNTLYEEYGTMPHQPEVTWFGWDGDRLVTTQTQAVRIQTVYQPGSFTPLLRIETETAALAKTQRRSLAEKLQQDAGIAFPAELVTLLNGLETELKRGVISERNQQWLNQCGLNPEQLKGLVEPECEPERKIHLYHCDHRGLPLALINLEGNAVWRAEYDEWGNQQMEDNPENLQQLIRLPGQQYDQETGLYYNRYRYYDAMQRRYITQDPIGLNGGWNLYTYPINPVLEIDPLGLSGLDMLSGWINQPGMKDAYNQAAAQYESIIKPESEWKFSKWEEIRGDKYFNSYINVNAVCEDQFGNTKSVNARTFQSGWFSINEIDAGSGILDPSENLGKTATAINKITDSGKGLIDAHSRALTCGSRSNYQCFDKSTELGIRLCGKDN
ncbi:RHS repeat-associated core domain-containing protein, partial [Kluyvera intermedia]